MESGGNYEDRRQHYRLFYPREFAPGLIINGRLFIVLDICERAVRFRRDASRYYESGQRISATLLFNDGTKFDVTGWVGRVRDNDVVVLLTKHIPYQKIMAEQVSLGKRKKEV
jgi:hypothetical protein